MLCYIRNALIDNYEKQSRPTLRSRDSIALILIDFHRFLLILSFSIDFKKILIDLKVFKDFHEPTQPLSPPPF